MTRHQAALRAAVLWGSPHPHITAELILERADAARTVCRQLRSRAHHPTRRVDPDEVAAITAALRPNPRRHDAGD